MTVIKGRGTASCYPWRVSALGNETVSSPSERSTDQAKLVASLCDPSLYGTSCKRVTVLETHISYVLLTGSFAYKIKKAVDLQFLDFTTLSARRFYCEQELRLNRRLAPALYLDVIAITGSVEAPVLGGRGRALEYAVKMREFPQDALASRLLERDELSGADVDALAAKVASFHASVDVAPAERAFAAPEDILQSALQNFAQIQPLLDNAAEHSDLTALRVWTEREHATCRASLLGRQHDGHIRECHGDLHLGNIARIDGELTIFDCIEFNDALRWIDVMSEVAFTVMDLHDRGRPDLGHRFLNAYVEITGDYAGLSVLRFYLVYRAMVRAKIARVRAAQVEPGKGRAASLSECAGYVKLAMDYTRAMRPAIVITHGLSGCGKTTLSQAFVELTGAIRVRTDVERKRLLGLGPRERSRTSLGKELYAEEPTRATYRHACALARSIVAAGRIALIDAAFLKRWQRDLFRALASELAVPFVIVDFEASEPTLRERIARRLRADNDASDADLAVLDHQLRTHEPLAVDESSLAVSFDAEAPPEVARSTEPWRRVLQRLEVEPMLIS